MILSDIRDYVRERSQVSLSDVMIRFEIDAETARNMLDVWIRKNKVHRSMATASCGSSCSHCDIGTTEFYIWGQAPVGVDINPPDYCRHS